MAFRIWDPVVVDLDNTPETQSDIEQPPIAELRRTVRTVRIQRTGARAYVQRHMPTGGMEIDVPTGGRALLLGPLPVPGSR